MFIKFEPGGLATPWTPPRIRGVSGARSATPVSGQEERPTRTPTQIVDRYRHMAHPDDADPHVEPAREVRQIMSAPVITLPPNAHLDAAWALVTARRFRHIPIIDAAEAEGGEPGGGLVGMLSDRDLLAAAAHVGQGADRDISEIMTTTVIACRPSTTIRAAAEGMLAQRVGALPVVAKSGALIGIVSRADILRAVIHDAPLELWI